ncbi:MAG: Sec-independent protein translocase protein TatB [Candidatus Oxydemutatoraceae bacterium WSBS_2016_MAG_OTU14]
MGDFGFWELALILLVALLIAGPKRLPHIAAELGKWVGRIRNLSKEFKDELTQEIESKELTKQIKPFSEDLKKVGEEVNETVRSVNQNLRSVQPLADALQKQIDEGERYAYTPLSPDLTEASLEETPPTSDSDKQTKQH